MTNRRSRRLKTWRRREGNIRLSEDDGPPAHTFLEDEYDDDNDGINIGGEDLRLDINATELPELPSHFNEPPSRPPPKDAGE